MQTAYVHPLWCSRQRWLGLTTLERETRNSIPKYPHPEVLQTPCFLARPRLEVPRPLPGEVENREGHARLERQRSAKLVANGKPRCIDSRRSSLIRPARAVAITTSVACRPGRVEYVIVLDHLSMAIPRDGTVLRFSLAAGAGIFPVLAAACCGRRLVIVATRPRRGLGRAQDFDAPAEVFCIELGEDTDHLLLHVAERVQQRRGDVYVERAPGFHRQTRASARRALCEDVTSAVQVTVRGYEGEKG